MFYLADKAEDLSSDTASQIALRDYSAEGRKEPVYIGNLATKTG